MSNIQSKYNRLNNHRQSTPFKVSIILATYNWHDALDVILSHLVPQILIYNNSKQHQDHNINSDDSSLNISIELIIADDGSTKDTENIISKYQQRLPTLKHIWHEDAGFRKAKILNKAVYIASGDYLIFLDGDCVPFPDYIIEHIKLAEAGYFVAGNRVLLSKSFTQEVLADSTIINKIFSWNPIQWFLAKFVDKKVNKLLPWLRLSPTNKLRYLRNQQWKYPKGCNFALWRKDFIAVNGFDETFMGWGHEDADLFIRLLHSGILIKNGRFALPVLHLWHKESSRDREAQNYQELIRRSQDRNCILAVIGIKQHNNS